MSVSLVECPRDAMQGWKHLIPTHKKIAYLQQLLQVGFDVLDCGSFVSAKAIPQMADTAEVIRGLDVSNTRTQLLVIVANERGAADAVNFESIRYLGFPFSISPTFQQRNTNSSIEESFERVKAIQRLCAENAKELVVYISMGFGNPYGDAYDEKIVLDWAKKITDLGVGVLSLADTVGLATPDQVLHTTAAVMNMNLPATIGVHLHSTPANWKAKLDAALQAGCTRFDGALKGIGGCPMANDALVGNMNMEWMIAHLQAQNLLAPLNAIALQQSLRMADEVFAS